MFYQDMNQDQSSFKSIARKALIYPTEMPYYTKSLIKKIVEERKTTKKSTKMDHVQPHHRLVFRKFNN